VEIRLVGLGHATASDVIGALLEPDRGREQRLRRADRLIKRRIEFSDCAHTIFGRAGRISVQHEQQRAQEQAIYIPHDDFPDGADADGAPPPLKRQAPQKATDFDAD
jgi:hypothetical protein